MIPNTCRQLITLTLTVSLSVSSHGANVWQTPADTYLPSGADPWPRAITTPGETIQVYQPQLNHWTGNTLDAYAAVAIQSQGSHDKAYGVICSQRALKWTKSIAW